jgi:hypothetical protein
MSIYLRVWQDSDSDDREDWGAFYLEDYYDEDGNRIRSWRSWHGPDGPRSGDWKWDFLGNDPSNPGEWVLLLHDESDMFLYQLTGEPWGPATPGVDGPPTPWDSNGGPVKGKGRDLMGVRYFRWYLKSSQENPPIL